MIQYPAAGIRNHSLLTGLSNDDHGQYLMLTPPNTARNTITVPTATVTGLTLKSTDDSAVLPLLDLQTSAGVSVLTAKTAIGGASATDNFLNITATLPIVQTTSTQAVYFSITPSSGATVVNQRVMILQLNAGYTGSNQSAALHTINSVAGTGTSLTSSNKSIDAIAQGNTTGTNIGTLTTAFFGLANYALHARSPSAKDNATNVAVLGTALNTGTNGIQVAGHFVLTNSTSQSTLNHESAAVVADNGSTVNPIILGRDNGTKVFQVLDGGGTSITLTNAASVGLTVTGAAAQSGNLAEFRSSGGVAFVTIGKDMLSGASATDNFLRVAGTFTAINSAATYGVVFSLTGAGSSGQRQYAAFAELLAGYTGAVTTVGFGAENHSAGTGNNFQLNSPAIPTGNIGLWGYSTATTTGTNFAVAGNADGGNINVAVIGKATTDKNNATNIGVAGFGANAGTTPIQIGGYFGLHTSTPTFESAALISDNGATTSPIFLARDNGTKVFEVRDGGQVYVSNGTLSGGSATENFLSVVGTLAAVNTAQANGVNINITSAGSSSQVHRAINVTFGAGYTGSSQTNALAINASVAGTSTAYLGGNRAISLSANGATTGTNIGILFGALSSSTLNIGGASLTATSTAGDNIGIYSATVNAGAGKQIAGLFILNGSTYPTFESTALFVDNSSQTSPIALFKDNGTTVFSIADGGAAVHTLLNAASIGLVVKGAAAQSANLQEWQNSSASVLSYIASTGVLVATNFASSTAVISVGNVASGGGTKTVLYADGSSYFGNSPSYGTAYMRLTNNQSSSVGFYLTAASGQTANLVEYWNGSGGLLATVSENGYFTTRKNAAPADAELAAGEAAYWFDSSNGASKFMVKAKSADGTVVTGEVALA